MAVDLIETSPLGYLHGMVSRFEAGDFILQFADVVSEMRSTPPNNPGNICSIEVCEVSCD